MPSAWSRDAASDPGVCRVFAQMYIATCEAFALEDLGRVVRMDLQRKDVLP